MQPLRIGKLARLAKVNVQTLRFYERKGLLPKAHRRLSGYREYPSEAVGLVILIKHIQALGFSLKEIKGIITLSKGSSSIVEDAAAWLKSKIEEIDAKIGELRELRNTLAKIEKTHRQGAANSFALAFEDHVRLLSVEAIVADNEKAREEKRKRAKKNAPDA